MSLAGGAAAMAATLSGPVFSQTQKLRAGELTSLTIREASELIKKKAVSSVLLTQACLDRIDKYEPALNAFITVTREKALDQARAMDTETAKGKWRGPLHGIPIALKDNIDTAGIRTTAASLLFAERVPSDDSEVVRRLKAAGAVILGKTNLLTFAGSTISTYYKPAINPWAPERFTTGSSSGSGVAVISEMCYGAIGTDTRGSIRGPASVMSMVGLKPTYGRVSNRGVIPLCWTLDTVGPMTRTVEDAAIMLQSIAGYDPADITSADVSVPDYVNGMKTDVKKLRIGFARVPYFDDLSPEFLPATNQAFETLGGLTGSTRDVDLPAVLGLGFLMAVETLAYHSQWYPKYKEGYPARWIPYLERAAQISAADYASARQEIDRLRRDVARVFEHVDLIITPARARYTPKLEDVLKAQATPEAPTESGFNYTQPFSVFGLPAMCIPGGFTKDGLPVGLQIIGPHWNESRVFALGRAFEQATEWHKRRPPLAA
jgi:aspartyl-tRNA(Asn)/glutamyl-tRNA(Gln) amidotransferase subunit A